MSESNDSACVNCGIVLRRRAKLFEIMEMVLGVSRAFEK